MDDELTPAPRDPHERAKGGQERTTTVEQDERIWDLHVRGYSTRKIRDQMAVEGVTISHRLAADRINERLDGLRHVTRETVTLYRGKQAEQIDNALVIAHQIAEGGPCPRCVGERLIWRGEDQVPCPKCEASGTWPPEAVRLTALNTIRMLLHRQAALTGLDAPERHELSIGAFDWSGRSDSELDRELDGLVGSPVLDAIEGTARTVSEDDLALLEGPAVEADEPPDDPPFEHTLNGDFG